MKATDQDKHLFSRYYRALCCFAWQMVQDESVAEDLAQDAFVAYLNNKTRLSDDENAIKSFLYASIKHAVYNMSRHNKVVRKFWERTVFTESDDIDYEHQIIRAEFTSAVHVALESLPEGCRKIMTMSYVDGYSNEDIAHELQISVNTIKTQKRRGLSVLREKLNFNYFWLFLFVLFVV
ncbi:RNA polymerase sigma-70 factor [Sphingobacterium sp. SGR-19]|jgi:RNA polymerase sigma-70 factor (family 1)|uniref:RNA polymerase sigma-70 factor n=1 Tax=Sphingobacterium sp. SGR-19 TaxID=2710886 RepID=UPI0013ECA4FD|nr:RNA polymerase sigma-70 factor [Sphingobacterium sp. SGR-19]NGM64597.1 RNA polymerase sigma-70 factor [Sphingobacterium sp. SGR-19]